MAASFCPRCGTPRGGGMRFCANCGLDFDQAPAAAPTGPASAATPSGTPIQATLGGLAWIIAAAPTPRADPYGEA